jgi:uncharacterized Tic20 family protein
MNETTQTTEIDMRDVRRWAMFCHLGALVALLGNGVGFLIVPLIVWLIKKDDHPFINEQGKESVNFQITMFLALFAGALLTLVLIGIPILIAAMIMMIVLPIVAAIKASNGESYRYPLTIRFIK